MGFFEFNENGGLKTDKVMRRPKPANPRDGDIRSHQPYKFSGADYVPLRDYKRLKGKLLVIFNIMADGKWRTLARISKLSGSPEASVSSQLRNLRKKEFGRHTVLREYIGRGLYRYKLIINHGGTL